MKHLTVVGKRLTNVYSNQYLSVENTILDAAKQLEQHPDDVRLQLEYPEVEWEWILCGEIGI